jgi:hypothetical protein
MAGFRCQHFCRTRSWLSRSSSTTSSSIGVPHRAANHASTGSRSSPWLVSMVMWLMFMRFVPGDGIAVRELQELTGFNDKEMCTWLSRMGKWWSYVLVVEPGRSDSSSSRSVLNWVVRPTSGGRKALEAWQPLTGIIEKRWPERFGKGRHRSPSRVIAGAGRQLRRRSA